MTQALFVVFPHQLFEHLPSGMAGNTVVLVEEHLFFTQYLFHKQKIKFHRSSMRYYSEYLESLGFSVQYIACTGKPLHIAEQVTVWAATGVRHIHLYRVEDDWLATRITTACNAHGITLQWYDTPQFILDRVQVKAYFTGKKTFLQANFYSTQRKRLNILLEGGKPKGGRWSFDDENRLRYPTGKIPPPLPRGFDPQEQPYLKEATQYVASYFSNNPGSITGDFDYPISHVGARIWLQTFLNQRFAEFGRYEDALVLSQPLLNHSLLSVFLNAGLLSPSEVLESALRYGTQHQLPLNEVEGFVRQLLGWREFVRGIYLVAGRKQRSTNYWSFNRKIPQSFYDGSTGIAPVDQVIKKVLRNGYCHHIERLMVLSNFMLLCAFDPAEVYQWFMELFIDAYDWVMVPNVYGMGQFADGGLMSTKPYISGSNYLLKMSTLEKDSRWTGIWDALYWRFVHVHRDYFLKNPRMGVMVKSFDRMPAEKQHQLLRTAEAFLQTLDAA